MGQLYKHTSGIALRRVEWSDLGDLKALKDESWFGTHQVTIACDASQEKWLTGLEQEDVHTPKNLVLVASHEVTGRIENIGVFKVFNVCWQSRFASVGWDIYKPYRGRGLGKKLVKIGVDFCFNVLNLHRLQADILLDNLASIRCAEAAGFTKDGFQKKVVLRGGKWIDNFVYGIIAPEPA
jgi:[ribosomal protein S5]-alanine N-acetyltransferase